MVRTPVKNHATSSQPALPIWRDMSAETIKIPEPIITPTTTITESKRPRPRANVGSEGGFEGVTGALLVINILMNLLVILLLEVARRARRRELGGCARRQISARGRELCERE